LNEYPPARHLIPSHVLSDSKLYTRAGMKGLTPNHDPNIGHPYASRDRYHELLPVPYCDASGTHEQLTAASPKCRGLTCGAQSRATRQQWPRTQRAENGKTTKRHRQTFIPPTEHNGGEARRTHELEDKLGLKTWLVRTQVHMG